MAVKYIVYAFIKLHALINSERGGLQVKVKENA